VKWTALAVIALALATTAHANPSIDYDVYGLDLGSGTNCVWPAEGQVFTATVYVYGTDHLYGHIADGIRGASFKLTRTFGGQVLSVTNLFSDWQLGGPSPEWDQWVVASDDCVMPDEDDVILLGSVEYLYLGPPGLLTIGPNSVDGLMVVDCNYNGWQIEYDDPPYNLRLVGGVGVVPPQGCGTTPVSDVSWGAIKALYR
jgi:hypothetical protein